MQSKQSIMMMAVGLAMFLFLVLIAFGDKGYFDLIRMREAKNRILLQNEDVMRENMVLFRTVDRLKSDPQFIESIAREELGMIGKDEVILKLSGKSR